MASSFTLLRPDAPGFWLLADILLGLALWPLSRRVPLRWQSIGRVLRWIALPYAALLAGAIAPQGMGLAGVDWHVGLTLGVGFVLGVLALLALARLAARVDFSPSEQDTSAEAEVEAGAVLPVIYSVLHHGAEEFHWCFQRAALLALGATWLGALDAPDYWAMWAAILIALPGVWTTPAGMPRLFKAVALIATTILFFYTRNFWLCWLLHAAVMLFAGVAHVRPQAAAVQR